jgi:hypothetical protein
MFVSKVVAYAMGASYCATLKGKALSFIHKHKANLKTDEDLYYSYLQQHQQRKKKKVL